MELQGRHAARRPARGVQALRLLHAATGTRRSALLRSLQSGQPWEAWSYEPYIALTTSTSDTSRYAEPAGLAPDADALPDGPELHAELPVEEAVLLPGRPGPVQRLRQADGVQLSAGRAQRRRSARRGATSIRGACRWRCGSSSKETVVQSSRRRMPTQGPGGDDPAGPVFCGAAARGAARLLAEAASRSRPGRGCGHPRSRRAGVDAPGAVRFLQQHAHLRALEEHDG